MPTTAGYSSLLLSELHEMNDTRYVRYRDIGRAIYGKHMARSIVAFQQIASLANNITLGIVAGAARALRIAAMPADQPEWPGAACRHLMPARCPLPRRHLDEGAEPVL